MIDNFPLHSTSQVQAKEVVYGTVKDKHDNI